MPRRCSAAPVDLPLTLSSLCLDGRKCKIAFVYRHADVMSGCCLFQEPRRPKDAAAKQKEGLYTCRRMEIFQGTTTFVLFLILQFIPTICAAPPLFACCPHLLLPPLLPESRGLNTRLRQRSEPASPPPPRYVPLLSDSTPDVIKNTTPADGSGQPSTPSVCPAIDYPSAGGHK